MKPFVAGVLVLATFISGSFAQSRTPNKTATQRVHSETIRICQGVPIPDGYVIIGYSTSSACPHGAYVLKKQASYDSSPATDGTNQSSSAPPISSGAGNSSKGRRTRSSQTRQNSDQPQTASGSLTGRSQTPVGQATGNGRATVTTSATRARRVTPEEEETPTGPPKLSGSQVATASGPPRLINPRSQSDTATPSDDSQPVAQPTPEEVDENDIVRVDTTLVTVPVSVLDHDGRFVPGLKREDFTLFENNQEQSIAYFEPAEKPFTVALLLDTSASTHFHLDEIKEAAIAFAKQLRPQDRVLIVSFNSEVLLLTEATNNLGLIQDVIEVNAYTGTSTRLYDAVDLTIKERLNQIKGRKAIVLFTDGVDTASQQATYESTLSEVDELDALIYPIQYDTTDYLRAMQNAGTITVTTTQRGIFGNRTSQQTYNVPTNNGQPLPGATKADYDRADRYLHELANKTGGRLYEANDTNQLAASFTRIAEELRRQYTIGYYPKTATVSDGELRQIRVRVRQPNLAVKARNSYVKSNSGSQNQ
jgi:Ca-activated chloride channel homolog